MKCETGKIMYKDYKAADQARRGTVITNIKKGRIGEPHKALNCYQCVTCGQWHVGHKNLHIQKGT